MQAATAHLIAYALRHLWKVQDSDLRCPRFQDVTFYGGLLLFAFVHSANLPFQNQRTSLRAGNSQNAKNGFATLGVILKKFETLWSFRTL